MHRGEKDRQECQVGGILHSFSGKERILLGRPCDVSSSAEFSKV